MDAADVIIVGAGAAGLAAAGKLTSAGLRTVLLDARERIGGRMFTAGEVGEAAVELGAEFIHGRAPAIFNLAGRAGLAIREITGRAWTSHDGTARPSDQLLEDSSAVFERLRRLSPPDRSFQAFLEDCCDDMPEPTRRAATAYVEGFHAAYADRISAFSIRAGEQADEAIDGHRQFRILGGYRRLAEAMAAEINPGCSSLELQHVVTQVNWQGPQVEVRAQTRSGERRFQAAAAILTLPLSLLQESAAEAAGVRFVPPLAPKKAPLSQLEMGHVVRVVLKFREPFWRKLTWNGESAEDMTFLFGSKERFPTWWTAWPSRAPLLVGWAAGPHSDVTIDRPATLEALAVSALARALQLPESRVRQSLEECHFHDWRSDPYSRGAYSYVRPGGENAPAELAKPLAGRLFFAGEATCSNGHHATVHGAIATGLRAAAEVIQRISAARR